MNGIENRSGRIYVPRLVDRVFSDILKEHPAISLVGARGTGKTTLASQRANSIAHIDRELESAAFRIDPDVALARMATPALVDEWQEVPGILGAVKRLVDDDPTSGRFILTGSVRIGMEHTWPATGRVVRQTVHGLVQREIVGMTGPTFVEVVARDVMRLADMSPSQLTLFDYLRLAATGGFPALALQNPSEAARRRWYASYLADMLTNDVKLVGADPDPTKLAAYVEAYGLNSAHIVDQATLRDTARISKDTAAAYEDLLESVHFSERVPAWRSSRLDRLVALPKRYVLDSGLLMHILDVTVDEAASDPRILGDILDTFVAMQIRPEVACTPRPPKLLHLRDQNGRHEVDLLLEYPRHRVVGIEVKATAAPGLDDARHLIWLRDRLGEDFLGGLVLHTGPSSFALSPGIVATPISSLWASL